MQIDRFIEALATQTGSAETLRAYRQALRHFESYLNEQGITVNQVLPSTITAYQTYRANNKGRTVGAALAPATLSRMLSVLSSYYEWRQRDSDAVVRNPAKLVRRPKVRNIGIRSVDDTDLETLITGITSDRDRAVVLLFVYSGFRLRELRNLNKTTITARRLSEDRPTEYFGEGHIIGKGNKERPFKVGPKALNAVKLYLNGSRGTDANPALFLSSRKQRLSCRAIQHIVESWCAKLGVSHIHPHQLRHSFATRSINGGMSSSVLQELMGHASLTTTQRYFHMKDERISREYFSAMEYVRLCSPV